jgi:hypothetical protein
VLLWRTFALHPSLVRFPVPPRRFQTEVSVLRDEVSELSIKVTKINGQVIKGSVNEPASIATTSNVPTIGEMSFNDYWSIFAYDFRETSSDVLDGTLIRRNINSHREALNLPRNISIFQKKNNRIEEFVIYLLTVHYLFSSAIRFLL